MAAPSYGSRWPVYASQWEQMEFKRASMAQSAARTILRNKERYEEVEAKTKQMEGARSGVPWWWIGPVHYRESSFSFAKQLAQGDPLGEVSTHEPAGLGPYRGADAWERAAFHILVIKNLHKVLDWRLEKAIYHWEAYNGWGYFNHGVPSAYVWAGSSIQRPGMYVADHDWDPTANDPRVGCASILAALMELDPTVAPARETADDDEPVKPTPELPIITVTVSPAGSARVVVVGAADG